MRDGPNVRSVAGVLTVEHPERRAGDRRKYNRRSGDEGQFPPYYEVFERIAVALERIAATVAPPAGRPGTQPGAPVPREARAQDAPSG
jgi:hypothetical protein